MSDLISGLCEEIAQRRITFGTYERISWRIPLTISALLLANPALALSLNAYRRAHKLPPLQYSADLGMGGAGARRRSRAARRGATNARKANLNAKAIRSADIELDRQLVPIAPAARSK